MTYPTPPILWRPSTAFIANANLNQYIHWLRQQQALHFEDYQALWAWSVEDPAAFWESVWAYFEVKSHTPYTQVLSVDPMPDAKWFAGSTLNYAEHIFKSYNDIHPAIIFQSERQALTEISWADLKQQVAALSVYLRGSGVRPGDRVVAYLPNIPEATVAFLAACAVGAVWSSCSPDFGANSVLDRFQQIEPTVFITVDGYQYNGKPYNKWRPSGSYVINCLRWKKLL